MCIGIYNCAQVSWNKETCISELVKIVEDKHMDKTIINIRKYIIIMTPSQNKTKSKLQIWKFCQKFKFCKKKITHDTSSEVAWKDVLI